jgi:CDP-diacylglycerol--glycerol-3-phosphate 3-phosphatidyltransferase
MGIYRIKPAFQRSLLGAENALVEHGVHPDVLTLGAVALSFLGGVALYAQSFQRWLLLAVPVVAILRTALNALDGLVAKRTGLARPWGEVLNEASDRVADVALFGGLVLSEGVNLYLGAGTIVLILLGSYVGAVSKAAGGPRQYGGVMGKADRMIFLSVMSVVVLVFHRTWIWNVFLSIVAAGAIVTILQRLVRTHADLRLLGRSINQ